MGEALRGGDTYRPPKWHSGSAFAAIALRDGYAGDGEGDSKSSDVLGERVGVAEEGRLRDGGLFE